MFWQNGQMPTPNRTPASPAKVAHRIACLTRTALVSPRHNTAGIRLSLCGITHRFEVDVIDGRFAATLTGYVRAALRNHFSPALRGLNQSQFRFTVDTIAFVIWQNHESELPRRDPRLLPLSLPPLGPKALASPFSRKKAPTTPERVACEV